MDDIDRKLLDEHRIIGAHEEYMGDDIPNEVLIECACSPTYVISYEEWVHHHVLKGRHVRTG